MRIKSLDIFGFKSFAEKAHFSFGTGITGIVGPNGCGKSNVIDAIKWCMGEMSAKSLRGRSMQDIIFNGSEHRGPMGMAEVTITFSNDGNVPPQFVDYEDISVTRRLHRDGRSEYLINKTPVRLRDITDLFLGTGVGTRAYSIIEQGRIGYVVNARPEDRRGLIEEVAGITKFKARKKAAERRLDATQQNLLRVNDIITELERQLNSLRRQAKKAERYKKLRDEQRGLELHAAAAEILRIATVEKVQKAEYDVLQGRLSDAQVGVATEETRLESDRLGMIEEEERLQVEQQKSAEIDARMAALERDLTHWRTQLEELTMRAQEGASEVENAKSRVAQAESEKHEFKILIEALNSQSQDDRERIGREEVAVEELQKLLTEADRKAEEEHGRSLEYVHQTAQQRTRAESLEQQRIQIQARLTQAQKEVEQADTERLANAEKRAELNLRFDELSMTLGTKRERAEAEREEVGRLLKELAVATETASKLKDERLEKRSRLDSLHEIARQFEGYSDGVRTLMNAATGEGEGEAEEGDSEAATQGIRSLVTDVFEVPSEYERAIEAALGDKLQYLIVDEPESGARAIEFLKEQEGGRSGFIPLAPRCRKNGESLADDPGLIGDALGLVQVNEGFEAIAEYLLGQVSLVRTVDDALRIGASCEHQKQIVTLQGEVLDSAGALSGGSGEGAGLLAKNREIRELEERLAELDTQFNAAEAHQRELEEERMLRESTLEELEREIRSGELEVLEVQKDLEAAIAALARQEERLETLTFESEQRHEELRLIDVEYKEAAELAEIAEAKRKELEEQLKAAQALRRDRAYALEHKSTELTMLQVRLATTDEKLESAQTSLKHLQTSEDELRRRIERGVTAMGESDGQSDELKNNIIDGQAESQEIFAEAQERREALSLARQRYDEERQRLGQVENKLRENRRENEAVQEALMQLKVDMQRLEMERARVSEHILERHDLDIMTVITDYHMLPPPGPEAVERRKEIDRSIKSMGPINLTAIEEHDQVEERYSFLAAQRDDLNEAIESLKRAIARINRTSRERFKEAFEAVNEMFQQVFPRLFRGGEARLTLTNEDDLLEAGVEIVAMPPGKRLQNVTLLSGGEKALTATALVFSIFLIKPSPFCVLDEVDAPLDDANVGRFNEMLQEISHFSQFIVITHNKLTMAEADKLYGVTMQDPGMSKIVAVDLDNQKAA